jgi:glycosyltransferase involved in cell wall biosynthesis
MTLGILYHMPFWQAQDGTLWEVEGSFARYVDSLAPYFDEIVLAVPVFTEPQAAGSRVTASNVRLAPMPYFAGPRQFYPLLPWVLARLRRWVKECDVIHLRVPSPAAIFAFALARRLHKSTFLLVVGDYQALLPHLTYRGWKRALFRAYVSLEEWALEVMTTRALTFANGAALRQKHERQGAHVHETKTTTLSVADIASRLDTCTGGTVRLLTVSRIDPRKGLRVLPAVVARLTQAGRDVTIDIIGPPIGDIGVQEQRAIVDDAEHREVGARVRLVGAVPLDQLLARYRDYDLFVLPTMPGEGIPRVLMEAMAAGLPVVTTNVSGIASLVQDGVNGVLVAENRAEHIADVIHELLDDGPRRRQLIAGGYGTVRAHTLERQAADMMRTVSRELQLTMATGPEPA